MRQPAEAGPDTTSAERLRRTAALLNWVRWVAIADFALLLPLLWATFTHNEGVIDILGPIHGVGFLILLGLVVIGALNKLWGWWFPIIVVATLGPIGSLIGDRRVRSSLRRAGS